ncbi:MAG: tRNA pseudouridine(38-40) synthase TruA [Actinobacteria bacterium]|nr:tRNA pseudouridine(38-40) synthase TruA [Actinomycetota bacterium]
MKHAPVTTGDGDSSGTELVRLRADIAYDGAGFSGWASQPGRRTVQQTLAEAFGRVLRLPEPPALTAAGRTDAGVHARGQVAHLDVPASAWAAAAPNAVRRLSRLLPPDVRVPNIGPAPAGFDARFSALWRRYEYRICDDPAAADPLRRHDTLWYPRRLDLAAMTEAARPCLGEHDFAAFCRRRDQGPAAMPSRGGVGGLSPRASTVRELLRLDWSRQAPSVAVATVVADAFCHNMVRALVGALVRVGDGARPPGWPQQVLAGRVRDPGVTVLPPHGLCLAEIRYPPDAELAERATVTRRIRTQA